MAADFEIRESKKEIISYASLLLKVDMLIRLFDYQRALTDRSSDSSIFARVLVAS
jgi:hypothetical protein